jgi:hypothetical protein
MAWEDINPQTITGFGGTQTDSGSGGMRDAVTTTAGVHAPAYSPQNPLFWVAVFLLAAGGFIAVTTSVKAGPVKGSASI